MVATSNGNARGSGKWTFVGSCATREFEQEAVICGNSVEVICREGGCLVKSLKFHLFDWPESREDQVAFLEERHPLSELEGCVGSTSGAYLILWGQMRAINGARERFARVLALF